MFGEDLQDERELYFENIGQSLDEKQDSEKFFHKTSQDQHRFHQTNLAHTLITREEEHKMAKELLSSFQGMIKSVFATPYSFHVLNSLVDEGRMKKNEKSGIRRISTKLENGWKNIACLVSRLNGDGNKHYSIKAQIDAQKDALSSTKAPAYLRHYKSEIANGFKNKALEDLESRRGIPEFGVSYSELKKWNDNFLENYNKYQLNVAFFVKHNQKLVYKIAKRFYQNSSHTIPLDELVQEGNIGLLKAIDRFEPARQFKFATYAIFWINQSINRYVQTYEGLITLPVYKAYQKTKIARLIRTLEAKLGKEPASEEIAKYLGLTKREVDTFICRELDTVSLEDEALEGVSMEEHLGDDSYRADVIVSQKNFAEWIRNALTYLSPREEYVIKKRFGIDGEESTLEEIGEELGVTRERIRQIENIALKKLRCFLETNHQESFLVEFLEE